MNSDKSHTFILRSVKRLPISRTNFSLLVAVVLLFIIVSSQTPVSFPLFEEVVMVTQEAFLWQPAKRITHTHTLSLSLPEWIFYPCVQISVSLLQLRVIYGFFFNFNRNGKCYLIIFVLTGWLM